MSLKSKKTSSSHLQNSSLQKNYSPISKTNPAQMKGREMDIHNLNDSRTLKALLFACKEEPKKILKNRGMEFISKEMIFQGEKNSWKNKVLKEDSLLHLLTLGILYANSYVYEFYSNLEKISQQENIICGFRWFQKNHFFFLKQEISEELGVRAQKLSQNIHSQQSEIIAEIFPYLIDWKWDRLSRLKQFVLITAWYLIKTSPPSKTAEWLNDAINHAKWFGEEKDYAFVNSILDKYITKQGLWSNMN